MPDTIHSKLLAVSLIAISCTAVIGGIAFIVTETQIRQTPNNKGSSDQTKTEIPSYHKCDLYCKANWERVGLTCNTEPDGNFLCKSASHFILQNVIPWGSEKMPYKRNFMDNSTKLSLEINNTLQWTNVDDFPHRIISDDGLFDSGIILPNQTWNHVFDKVGVYYYHGDHPWLKGVVRVVPVDPNYNNGKPIVKGTNDPTIWYVIFRGTDHNWSYVQKISVLDGDTVSILLDDYQSPESKVNIQKTLKIGDRIVGGCGVHSNYILIYYLTLERIVNTGTPFAEFREDDVPNSLSTCSFNHLIRNNGQE